MKVRLTPSSRALCVHVPHVHILLVVSEFMVEEHELQKEKIQEDYNDKYWDQRYTIVQHRIPSYLQKMADKILSTGIDKLNPAMMGLMQLHSVV